MANDDCAVAVDLNQGTDEDREAFWKWIVNQQMIAHNTMFDFSVILKHTGQIITPYADTYILFANLASEYKRPWGLEAAMYDILGAQKLSSELAAYMKKSNLKWDQIDDFDWNVLGRYAGVDAIGHWELFKSLRYVIDENWDEWGNWFWGYHTEDCMNAVMLQIEAKAKGMCVDVLGLEEVFVERTDLRAREIKAFFSYPIIAQASDKYKKSLHSRAIREYQASEPPKMTKTGKVSVRWQKWQDRQPNEEDIEINIASKPQLKDLLFNYANLDPVLYTEKKQPSINAKALNSMGPVGGLLIKYSKVATELQFLSQIRNTNISGKVYPNIKFPATVTGRVGGGTVD